MNPPSSRSAAAGAAGAMVLSAAWLTAPGQPSITPRQATDPALALACTLDAAPGRGARLLLTNTGPLPLPRGTRFAWVSLGTPAAVGEILELPRALERGESETVYSDHVVHGSGCLAVPLG